MEVFVEWFGEDIVLVCLVFLENGCIVYVGYFFVNDIFFSESGMQNYLLMFMCDFDICWVFMR